MATLLQRFYEESLAQASYMLGCMRSREALVVDANRDVEQYVAAASERGLRIAHVTETHIHADYVSGARELAARTGAQLYLSVEGGPEWQYEFLANSGATPLRAGGMIRVGDLRVDVMHTPGHTPEHLTLVVTEPDTGATPMGAFTGDFVFVGDVGRPDLLERAAGISGTMRESAARLFASLREFKRLPDYTQIWPGHGAGSPCGKALGAVPQTTVGYERHVNWAFAEQDEEAFIGQVLDGQPEPPRYFAIMKRVNRAGPEPLPPRTGVPALSETEFVRALGGGATVIDARPAASYAQAHLEGTINIPVGKSFPIWAGSVVPYDRPLCVIVENSPGIAAVIVRQLGLIGLDAVLGSVTWETARALAGEGARITASHEVPPAQLREAMAGNELQVVDVRNGYEWSAGHIQGARHIPLAQLADRLEELDPARPVVVHCERGGRSAVAASLLEARGFSDVANLAGGYTAWEEAIGD